jgi:hypothetical protein
MASLISMSDPDSATYYAYESYNHHRELPLEDSQSEPIDPELTQLAHTPPFLKAHHSTAVLTS